jgi:hypothetical protein
MGIEGRLTIGLRKSSGCVDQVSIDSSRPLYASRVFHNKSVAETLKSLPLLFSICGTAQACAAVRACEQALGIRPAARIERLREGLVRMETIREHLWRILLDWPPFIGETPEKDGMVAMLALQRDFRRALSGGCDPFLPAGADQLPRPVSAHDFARRIAVILGLAVFARSPLRWLDIDDPKSLEKWAASGATAAARLLHYVMRMGWNAVGGCDVAALPLLEAEHLHRVLRSDEFIARPQWFGSCRETSSSTRVDTPLLRQSRARHGNGLLTRLVARLTEMAQLSVALSPERPTLGEQSPAGARNPGIGQVAAARGQLLHRVRLEGDRIVLCRL